MNATVATAPNAAPSTATEKPGEAKLIAANAPEISF
jgi:hypothetical protein